MCDEPYQANLERLNAAADRINALMGFAPREGKQPHRFEQIRMLWRRYEAIPVSVEKLEAICERIEELERREADRKLMEEAELFLAGMAEPTPGPWKGEHNAEICDNAE